MKENDKFVSQKKNFGGAASPKTLGRIPGQITPSSGLGALFPIFKGKNSIGTPNLDITDAIDEENRGSAWLV